MPSFGGLAPFARRFGGEPRTLEAILQSLNDQMGTALDTSPDSPIYMRNLALARAIADVWDTSQALANQFDWNRVTSFLPRWERIFAIFPRYGATITERREALARRWSTIGLLCAPQAFYDSLATALSGISYTVSVQTISGGAAVRWPYAFGPTQNVDGGPSVTISATNSSLPLTDRLVRIRIDAGGVRGVATFVYSLDGGVTWSLSTATNNNVTLLNSPPLVISASFSAGTYVLDQRYWAQTHPSSWSADTSLVDVICPKPTTMSEAEYASRVAQARDIADRYLPAWVDVQFIRDGAGGAGFFLDENPNLSAQRFR
jgi:hypothetical protein